MLIGILTITSWGTFLKKTFRLSARRPKGHFALFCQYITSLFLVTPRGGGIYCGPKGRFQLPSGPKGETAKARRVTVCGDFLNILRPASIYYRKADPPFSHSPFGPPSG